jgi:internalin A
LPEALGELTKLEELWVNRNKLTVLPDVIGKLTRLSVLRLHENELAALPESLRRLTNLKELNLHNNPGLGLPPEVLGGEDHPTNPTNILNYYFSTRVSHPLNEAKMIFVGRGGVGKTWLVNRLVHSCYDSEEKKTDGIAITPWLVQVGTDQVRLNIWDFGGQEIMHATHQFFLTKRSLYLLVLNALEGEQDANVEYWLQLIESFGAASPVLVVINKVKDHAFDLNRRGLQAEFPAIRSFFQTDCDAQIGLEELQQAILHETDRLEHLRDPFPASWFTVKDTLANLPKSEGQNFIPFARYQQICAQNGVQEATSQKTLVGFLHDLGIVVNFRDDPRLAETHVLNPEWVTNGIYKILNAETLAHQQGELRLAELPGVLDAAEYPKAMHLYLLDLMRKFELCYEFYESAGHCLVPELLGKEEPDLNEFAAPDALRFEYRYNIVPEGLLPRFIVRSRALNRDLPRWRTGVVLAWDGNRAVVKADVQDKRVSIAITGPLAGRRRLLAVIRADLEHIHRSIAKLQPVEQVPVPGHPGLAVEYESLRVLEAEAETEMKLVNDGKLVKVAIAELLNGVEEAPARAREARREAVGREALRVAFSYAHKDEELRDQLETHLKLFQRQGLISTWHDRKIMPGDKWVGVIDDNFKRADLILLLVSADFVASDYCYEIEMQTALEREAKREAKVVPVILRACNWSDAPFSKLQALPKDAEPVTSWSNRDEAWNDVAKGIKKVAEEFRSRRR